jgi:hypothetical protein
MDACTPYGGPKVRSDPCPAPGTRFGDEELRLLWAALEPNTLFSLQGT